MDRQATLEPEKYHFISKFLVWVQKDHLEDFSREWHQMSLELSELGVIDGRIERKDSAPSFAILIWKDKSCWQSYKNFCSDSVMGNPVQYVSRRIAEGAVMGFEMETPWYDR